MYKFDNYHLGNNDELVSLTTSDEHRSATLMMAGQCRWSVDILSRNLDPEIYDSAEFVDPLKRMVLENRRGRVRVVVFEPESVIRRGHRLVDAAMQLPTFFELRKAGEEHKNFNGAVFVADGTGFIQRTNWDRYEGSLNFNDRARAQILLGDYEEIWGRAAQDPNLRRLSL